MTTYLQSHKDVDVMHANGDQMIAGAVQAHQGGTARRPARTST